MAAVVKKWCVTDPVAETVIFDWKIENILTQCSLKYCTLSSKRFSSKNLEWRLKIARNKEDVAMYIELITYSKQVVLAACKFSIGNDLYARDGAWGFDTDNDIDYDEYADWAKPFVNGFRKFISFGEIKQYVSNDQLVVRCELKILCDGYNAYHFDSESSVPVPKCTLKDDMNSLIRDGKYSDVTLVAGSKEFKAHKSILSTRSPVFAGMFEHEMRENTTGKVDIPDIRPEILQEVLTYIYTGDCPALQENTSDSNGITRELVYAADKYQLERLKVICEHELNKTITVDSVAETLLYADMHNAQQLKQSCIRFIIAKRPEVSKTPAWKEVKKCRYLYRAICEQAFGDTEEEPSAKRPRL